MLSYTLVHSLRLLLTWTFYRTSSIWSILLIVMINEWKLKPKIERISMWCSGTLTCEVWPWNNTKFFDRNRINSSQLCCQLIAVRLRWHVTSGTNTGHGAAWYGTYCSSVLEPQSLTPAKCSIAGNAASPIKNSKFTSRPWKRRASKTDTWNN